MQKRLLKQLCGMLFLSSLTLLSSCKSQEAVNPNANTKELNIYNWGDYIAPNVIKNFEKEYGIKVNYDTYDSNEILQAKLVAGSSGYDIVVPSSPWADLQIRAGLYQKLNKSLIPNLKNENPEFLKKLAMFDPGNDYLVDWSMIFTTIGINTNKVAAAIHGPLPKNEWELLFNPKYISKLQACGVTILDSPSDLIPQALLYLGKNPYSANKQDYVEVDKLLRSIRPYISRISGSGHIDDLANGAICIAFVYSGDINIARKRAIDNKTGQNITALVPDHNVLLEPDTMAIPADAKNVKNANLFINYMLRPEVQATTTSIMLYPTANQAAEKYANEDALRAKGYILPTEKQFLSMEMAKKPGLVVNRLQTRTFAKFKANNY